RSWASPTTPFWTSTTSNAVFGRFSSVLMVSPIAEDLVRRTNAFRRSPFHEALEILGAVLAGEMDRPIRKGLAGFFVTAEGVVLANLPIGVRALEVGMQGRDRQRSAPSPECRAACFCR